jgi:molybdopterin-binding protein
MALRSLGRIGTPMEVRRLQLSARNQLKGTILSITMGAVSTEVIIEANGMQIAASITTTSAKALGLKVGDEAYAVIKASSVMIAKD